jgi:hypothetical protein
MAHSNTLPISTAQGGQDRLVLDNLIRRELKVGDPSDPAQVAQALLTRYSADPRAQAIGQESRGLPFLQAASSAPPVVQMLTAAGGAEWQQALDDINQDLQHLSTSALVKDVAPEIRGWGQAIRTTLSEGYDAARFGLDPRNRDKGFAMRRQLNDYARLARLVGAHTPAMLTDFRKLAQSLDEAANLLLVIMGEALANVGFGGGRYIPQVAYADLQTRRDAVIYALRNLVGSTQQAYGPDEWPRGLDAYRQLNDLLEAQGQNDLRSLLIETELARTMDELVRRGGDNTADGLRSVGSTSLLTLERFRRLVAVSRRGISPESPALYAYLEALQLFASAFDSAGGFRLMKIARPPLLFYGLYGSTGLDDADRRIVDLATRRGLVADAIDCFASSCCQGNRTCLVLLDKLLYDIDRAIDLYGLGFANFGSTERRASAYAFMIDQVLLAAPCRAPGANQPSLLPAELVTQLNAIADELRPDLTLANDPVFADAVARAQRLAAQLGTLMQARGIADPDQLRLRGTAVPPQVWDIEDLAELNTAIYRGSAVVPPGLVPDSDLQLDAYLGVIEQELCLQLDMERNWSQLVHSMVANCAQIDVSLSQLQAVVQAAVRSVAGHDCRSGAAINLPPTLETSLDSLVDSVERTGLGRPHRTLSWQRRT